MKVFIENLKRGDMLENFIWRLNGSRKKAIICILIFWEIVKKIAKASQ